MVQFLSGSLITMNPAHGHSKRPLVRPKRTLKYDCQAKQCTTESRKLEVYESETMFWGEYFGLRKTNTTIQFRKFSLHLLPKNVKIKIIVSAILYAHRTWFLILREEHKLRTYEDKVLRNIMDKVETNMRMKSILWEAPYIASYSS